jgi:hypothetical protein
MNPALTDSQPLTLDVLSQRQSLGRPGLSLMNSPVLWRAVPTAQRQGVHL